MPQAAQTFSDLRTCWLCAPRRPFVATTFSTNVLDVPGVQVVPAAIGRAADQEPAAQRWKESPFAAQYQRVSSVHGPDIMPLAEVMPDEAGGAAEAVAADGAAPPEPEPVPAEGAAGIGETTAVEVAAGDPADEAPPAPEAKTPPPLADGAAAEAEPAAAEVAAGEAAEAELPDEEPPDDVLLPPDEVEVSPPVQPVGGPKLTPMLPFWTLDPGFGYWVSTPSVVAQPLETPARLATKRAGYEDWRFSTFGAGA